MPKTLLLADDSVTIQKVVGISFANEDVRIVTVDNGDDAVKRARELRPDIVLADVVMPGKSGYDVCAAIKGDPQLRGVPVLLLTGTFETFDEDRAARVGADGHITKPFEAQALVELVNARLAGASAARAATKPPVAAPARAAAPEPEPFDFLEPEASTQARPPQAGTRPPVAPVTPVTPVPARDAFAFDAGPADAIDLEAERNAEVDLGNEATAARTTLLLDEAFADAETAPPVAAQRALELPADAEQDELTRLVLPVADEGACAPPPAEGGDPLEGVFSEAPREALFETPGDREWDVSTSDLDDPLAARALGQASPPAPPPTRAGTAPPVFTEPLFGDEPAEEPEFTSPPVAKAPRAPAAAAPLIVAAAAPPAAAASEASPQLRDAMHEALEKVAWEAFGDLSERIVRDAVARIEQVAWDVIPRLAETLIREEIRKLKGEE